MNKFSLRVLQHNGIGWDITPIGPFLVSYLNDLKNEI